MKIRKLSSSLISLISSGPIVSSPENILKELIENAIDSGASRIKITIKSNFHFQVVDNGCGIPYEELPKTIEQFTTSKIEKPEDLKNLETFGFRGEALHAIAQVSKLTIKTKFFRDLTGGLLSVREGSIEKYHPIPYPGGTSVTVEDLYLNSEIRKKTFSLKTRKKLLETAKKYALSHPNITFIINGQVFPAASQMERVIQILGKEQRFTVLKSKGILLFIGEDRERKNISYIYVNRRPIKLEEIDEIMGSYYIKNYILFLTIPSQELDLNVSPSKETLIIKDRKIFTNLSRILDKEIKLPKIGVLREKKELPYETEIRLIGSDGTILVGADSDFIYFFDQHLIHERVNYEILLRKLKEGKFSLRELVPPLKAKSLPSTISALKNLNINFVKQGETLLITAIPEILNVRDLEDIIKGRSAETIAEIACKRAIKAGYYPIEEDIENLFRLYLNCKEREKCPHGRRIYYKMRKQVIKRKLGRS